VPDRLYIPAEVEASIRDHVRNVVARMPEVFDSAEEDEDVVTGDFGALIRRGPVDVLVDTPEAGGTWSWSITYRKLRGRGPGATEKLTGADGIWEFTLDHGANGPQRKAALFQAKMAGEAGARLFAQTIQLSTWREAAFVIEYLPRNVFAVLVDDVVASRGKAISVHAKIPFDDFLINHFIGCKVGDPDVFYDRKNRSLFWRNYAGEIVVAHFAIRHKFDLNVKPPWYSNPHLPRPNLELKPHEIHLHRMSASPREILGVSMSAAGAELKKARHHIAKLYHPDKAMSLDEQLKAAMNRRMAEANEAFDELVGKNRRRR
jgi:hypothetical protein